MLPETKEKLVDNMAENLPVLRKKAKMSQEDLADIIGNSRYTIMSIESKSRRMTWGTFLSLILLFDKKPETSALLRALDIYTDELDDYLKQPELKL